MIKQVAYLFAGTGVGTLLPFIRNIIIARMISVEDFGVATTFALVFAFIEMITNVSHGRLIVQAEGGDGVEFQGSLQSFHFLRGLVNAVVLLVAAHPLADFLQVPDAAWAFQVMAVCPLMRGLSHFDMLRDQRAMKFSTTALATAVPPLVSFVTAFALLFVYDDYRVMLWAIIAQQTSFTIVSHLLSKRAYRLLWNFDVIKTAFTFGLPLLGSNILMFLNFQGDRLIVGNQLGPEELGWYSVAFLLVATPTLSIANTYQVLTLPPLSRLQKQTVSFRKQAALTLDGVLFISSLIVLGVALLGPAVLILVFGERYSAALAILLVFAIAQAIRIVRAGVFIILISRARTDIVLYTSMIRVLALPCSYILLASGHGVPSIILCAIAGEAAATLFGLVYCQKKRLINTLKHVRVLLLFVAFLGICYIDSLLWPPATGLIQNFHLFQLVLIVSFLGFAWSLKSGREFLVENVLQEITNGYFFRRRRGGGS